METKISKPKSNPFTIIAGEKGQAALEEVMAEEVTEEVEISEEKTITLDETIEVGKEYLMSINGKNFNPFTLTKSLEKNGLAILENRKGTRIHINKNKVKVKVTRNPEEIERLKQVLAKTDKIRKEEEERERQEKEEKETKERLEEEKKKIQEKKEEIKTELEKEHKLVSHMDVIDTLLRMIEYGIKNIWMVGPAGSGKSTMVRVVAQKLKREAYVLSCGIGTSSTEFIGYKYPSREPTPFASFYTKKSIILLDEFTALDPAVAQIANAALANDELYTTTGLIKRNDCIIIATSNTFGTGADMSYVANNQLDASTIDRFVGGIINVDYSEKYESQFDNEIREYVNVIREVINKNGLQRIASTRMLIEGEKLKNANLNWRNILITNWTREEKELLNS